MKIILDRIGLDKDGKKIATFEVGEKMVSFKEEQVPLNFLETLIPNAIVECDIIDDKIANPVILVEETKAKEEKMRNRLNSLFKRKN